MEDERAIKIANARRKVKEYQERKKNEQIQNIPENAGVQSTNIPDLKNNVHIQPTTTASISSQQTRLQNSEMNVSEMLLQEKRALESNLSQLSEMYANLKKEHNQSENHLYDAQRKISHLETIIKSLEEVAESNKQELNSQKSFIESMKQNEVLYKEKYEDLEEKFQAALSTISQLQVERDTLNRFKGELEAKLESNELHIQQISNGQLLEDKALNEINYQNQTLQQEVSRLGKTVAALEKEKISLNEHYSQYVESQGKQLKQQELQLTRLKKENEDLQSREDSLLEQMQELEKQLQLLYKNKDDISRASKQDVATLTDVIAENPILKEANVTATNYSELEQLKMMNEEKDRKLEELQDTVNMYVGEKKDLEMFHLANESDKIAAQRATAQNTKLKEDLVGLENAIVALSNEKLELTEKLDAEKFLNRELTLKLAEIADLHKDSSTKLKLKDEEMIRLQSMCSNLEDELNSLKKSAVQSVTENGNAEEIEAKCTEHIHECSSEERKLSTSACTNENIPSKSTENSKHPLPVITRHMLAENFNAMEKVEGRFIKLMQELAELSDEKQKLEHLVSQLQYETETIGEYVALYQQQRGILRQRDAEREAQMRSLSSERDNLKKQLHYLKQISDGIDIPNMREEVQSIISRIEQSHLIHPNVNCASENFHPCPWCSGKLINV